MIGFRKSTQYVHSLFIRQFIILEAVLELESCVIDAIEQDLCPQGGGYFTKYSVQDAIKMNLIGSKFL